ncbi:unnamed protein product [Gongylonema pulchrum]|uniref:BHLH domain-containing protein n=1 Tax=Gongylonema pulchrum TaxID=637853 RepID=A0A183DTT3_9BILA|nr:unnamed protein product [Gongylonema pulchrum]
MHRCERDGAILNVFESSQCGQSQNMERLAERSLERQQENLRAVLYPLRKNDWPSRLQSERIALLSITASINELKQKLEAIVA